MMLKCVDLCAGTGGFSAAFEASRDWDVITVDIDDDFNPDYCIDVRHLSPSFLNDADVVLASPPCTTFSMAAVSHHWDKDDDRGLYVPDSETAEDHLKIALHVFDMIREASPPYWFVENPRALMRKVIAQEREREPAGTVSWCQYGDVAMKPTDLWGDHPASFKYRMCANGEDCHESAPRGSDTGTQGKKDAVARAAIPYGLSLSILEAAERGLNGE